MYSKSNFFAFLLSATLILSACGGGSTSSNSENVIGEAHAIYSGTGTLPIIIVDVDINGGGAVAADWMSKVANNSLGIQTPSANSAVSALPTIGFSYIPGAVDTKTDSTGKKGTLILRWIDKNGAKGSRLYDASGRLDANDKSALPTIISDNLSLIF
jgi:hypothetical protein